MNMKLSKPQIDFVLLPILLGLFSYIFVQKFALKVKQLWFIEGFYKGRDFWAKKEIFVNSSENTFILQ